jgi:hypothetical protein
MTITLTREEAQQVLDALEQLDGWDTATQGDIVFDPSDEIEILRARLNEPEPEYRDVVIKGDLWRIEFLPDHAASVVLVRANYEAQPEPEPVACPFPCGWKTMLSIIFKDGAFLARGLIEGETVTSHQREVVMRLIDYAKTMASHGITVSPQPEPPCKTGSQCIGGKCPQCVVSEPEPVMLMDAPLLLNGQPLYTAPPQREWQGLTEAERLDILDAELTTQSTEHFALAQAIEAKLKEKNT